MAMHGLELVGAILMIITSVLIVIMVMFQDPKGSGLAGLSGGNSDASSGRTSNRTLDAILSKYTKFAAIVFFVLTIGVYAIAAYL